METVNRDKIVHDLIISYHRQGWSIPDIAEEMNLPYTTVKNHILRFFQTIG